MKSKGALEPYRVRFLKCFVCSRRLKSSKPEISNRRDSITNTPPMANATIFIDALILGVTQVNCQIDISCFDLPARPSTSPRTSPRINIMASRIPAMQQKRIVRLTFTRRHLEGMRGKNPPILYQKVNAQWRRAAMVRGEAPNYFFVCSFVRNLTSKGTKRMT
jgi:hypothetical protein